MYFFVTKIFKSAYSYCPNYILNDMLSNLMVNKKVQHKNAAMSKNNICSLNLTVGWSIKKIQTNDQ
jgi:hypothetical protein